MKALFLVFHGFQSHNGISKKIGYQIDALKECGMDIRTCYYEVQPDGHRQWLVDGEVLEDLGQGITAKIKKRISFASILRYIRQEGITWVYIRYHHNANPFTIRFVRQLKQMGTTTLLEIPTYPYDKELMNRKTNLYIDRIFRNRFCHYMDAIVTYSNHTHIFQRPTIRISNGIDFSQVALRNTIHDIHKELHLIGVAEIHFWHGFDRLITGLGIYYSHQPTYQVHFHLVGQFFSEQERQEIEVPIQKWHLQPYVHLYGPKHGKELDDLFEQADFAIGSLGRHRSGITHLKTLKNREYAARGFAFAYSENDDDFDRMPYVLKVPADETPIDIMHIIRFCQQQTCPPKAIRDSISYLSWKNQMQQVVEESICVIRPAKAGRSQKII